MLPTDRPGYRPDIDGLRALAVFPVLLYHAGLPGVAGGYVGVDVFFVISGFLITGIVAREIDDGRFSLVDFYERRARRILPALFAVVAFVLAGAAVLFLPGDFESVPRSALAALLFVANLWFFSQTGYFQGGSETMPLLHTWSLGVEEQFYIVFPLLLLACARHAARWRNAVIALAALVSFAWAVAVQSETDGFAFYMLPTRAWELLLGAMLALGMIPAVNRKGLRDVLAWTGFALIAGAVFLYDRNTVFPGLAALPPVIGAALLLHCGPGTRIGALLSLKGPVFVGAISYSLYLWHWPLIVFTEYAQDEPLTVWQSAALVLVSTAVAWFSWRYIEAPFRSTARVSRAQIFTASTAGMAVLGAIAIALVSLDGWSSRFPGRVSQLAAARYDISPRRDSCIGEASSRPGSECTLGAAGKPSAVVWGDSHGVELAWELGRQYAARSASLAQRTRPSCPPVLDWYDPRDPGCARFNAAVLREIEADPGITRVYLAAFWLDQRFDRPKMATGIERTIARLQRDGKQVVFVAPVPVQPFEVPRHLARVAARGEPATAQWGATTQSYEQQSAWLRRRFDRWRAGSVQIIDPARALVDGPHTRIVADGKPLYFDSHHLSLAGARRVLEANREL